MDKLNKENLNKLNETNGQTNSPSKPPSIASKKSKVEEKTINSEVTILDGDLGRGWTEYQEKLLAGWADKAICYRWMHDRCHKYYTYKNRYIAIPVIILSTLSGAASIGSGGIFVGGLAEYSNLIIGGVSIFTGIISTIGNYLRYAELSELHRVAAINWSKLQRNIATELALAPAIRTPAADFMLVARSDMDRLMEQSPIIHDKIIIQFKERFRKNTIEKPVECDAIKPTFIYHVPEISTQKLEQVVGSLDGSSISEIMTELDKDGTNSPTNQLIIGNVASGLKDKIRGYAATLPKPTDVLKIDNELLSHVGDKLRGEHENIDIEIGNSFQPIQQKKPIILSKHNNLNMEKLRGIHSRSRNNSLTNIQPPLQPTKFAEVNHDNFANGIGKIGNSFTEYVDDKMDKINSAISGATKIYETTKNVVSGSSKPEDIRNALQKELTEIANRKASKTVGSLKDRFEKAIAPNLSLAENIINSVASNLQTTGNNLTSSIERNIQNQVNTIANESQTKFNNISNEVQNQIENLTHTVSKGISDVQNNIVNHAENSLEIISSTIDLLTQSGINVNSNTIISNDNELILNIAEQPFPEN